MKKDNCIIVGAGRFSGLIKEISRETDYVIAADGGFLYLEELGIVPDLVIGDLDSLSEQLSEEEINRIENKIILPVMKDETDLFAAVKKGIEVGCRVFHIYGAMGGRIDHTIANIQILHYIAEQNKQGFIYDKEAMLSTICNTGISFPKEATGGLSVFSLDNSAKGVTIKGMKYLLDHVEVTNTFPIGISNEFIGEQATISVEQGTLLLVVC